MDRILKIIPDSLLRLLIVFSVLILSIFIIKTYVIPEEIQNERIYRTAAIERELAKELQYAGSAICGDCHDEVYAIKKDGYHGKLSCEVCHGPNMTHTDNPDETTPETPSGRDYCSQCHTYNPSRPTGFPQINPVAHNPLEPCISCHDPHDPEPPEIPHECVACHAEIARTKAVSPHVFLECITCHSATEEHKINPRSEKPSKPLNRTFCGSCHDTGSKVKSTPKIDVASHGEKYLCWQCHYPHMPEIR